MKILVVSFAGIGDTLLATPLIRELRLQYPEATLDAFVRWPGSRDLLENNPHLNTIFLKDLIQAGLWRSWRFLSKLRGRHYDVSINTYPQGKMVYRLVTRVIGARERLSHRYEKYGWKDSWLVNRTVAQDYNRHSVENNLNFLELLGLKPKLPQPETELFLTPAEQQWAAQFISQHHLTGRPILGVHVGSGTT